MADVLDPLTLPLHGSQLIEASAGTGKTWTIAALYVRLVLGHGAPGQCFGRPLLPGEILVMTFTKAATRELSDRIRGRLVESAKWFRGEATDTVDDFLTALRATYPDGPARQEAAWRLAMAAEAMDDAAVFTIDAWCQRMLREHAFDSGCLFDEELQANEAALVVQAVHDYWRQQVYPLDQEALGSVLDQWKGVDGLMRDVKTLLGKPLPADAGEGTLAECIARGERQRNEALAKLKDGWEVRADQMLAWLQPIWNDKKHPARKGLPGESHAKRWIQALKDWAIDLEAVELDLGKGKERLSHEAMLKAVGPGSPLAVPPCFADFDALMQQLKSLPKPGPALRLHAVARVAERMQEMKRQSGTFGFADMLDRLDAALDESVHGAKAQRLRQRIVEQYPVALIDEFQDTSPVQLRIFDRLYRIADNDPARALLLIGDPKQAIYGFRGADIYSYLGARQSTQGRHHVLGTNHRSTKDLVAAVNFMFAAAESRPGTGAFMFRGGNGSGDESAGESAGQSKGESALPFVAVEARGRKERLVTSAGDEPAVIAVVDTELRNGDDSRTLFASLCAERIVTLLNDSQAGFAEAAQGLRRLRPADMAVLVRSGREAEAVRAALRRRGLASVYLSDKDSVFQTDEAADLLRLLQSVAAPRDVRLARAAFATALLGLTLDELVALACDDDRFDRQCEQLVQLNLAWKHQGVLAMIRRALHAFDLPSRLLASTTGAGERRLTNVLHLAELLQAASAQVDGEQALIRWLTQQIEDADAGLSGAGTGGDDVVLRLESDADLVKVVTVHKSKGLEYPLVFLPFLAHFREFDGSKDPLVLRESGSAPTLVLSPTEAQVAIAQKERLREDLRLLYVALTRAQHALWVGLSGLVVGRQQAYVWHRSAIGYLLSGPEEQLPTRRILDIEALGRDCPRVVVQQMPPDEEGPFPAVTRIQARETLPALAMPPVFEARFDRNWAISSYSALVRDAGRDVGRDAEWAPSGAPVPVRALLEDEPDEVDGAKPTSLPARRPADQSWHRFPRGAFAGNFLHDLLEWLATEGFALETSTSLQQALVRRCERQGWGHRSEDVLAWLRLVCTTPLMPSGTAGPAGNSGNAGTPGASLAALAGLGSVTPEMEFWFPSDGMQAGQIDSLCQQHLLPGRLRPALPERSLKGMLMGFADLVFEHEGQYWVLDYKSNALGAQDADYTAGAMEAAMLDHRYDVQAALYLLALHRLLRSRLGAAYAPAHHLGGAIYYFLRGIRSATGGCYRVAPPLSLLEALDQMLLPGSEDGARDIARNAGEPA